MASLFSVSPSYLCSVGGIIKCFLNDFFHSAFRVCIYNSAFGMTLKDQVWSLHLKDENTDTYDLRQSIYQRWTKECQTRVKLMAWDKQASILSAMPSISLILHSDCISKVCFQNYTFFYLKIFKLASKMLLDFPSFLIIGFLEITIGISLVCISMHRLSWAFLCKIEK